MAEKQKPKPKEEKKILLQNDSKRRISKIY